MNWPALPYDAWQDTYATLHRISQVLGKVRTAMTPLVNHYWNSALEVGPRGLRTGAIPFPGGHFEMELDFVDHRLLVRTSDGGLQVMKLENRPVSACFDEILRMLESLGIEPGITDKPCEIKEDAIPFRQDTKHRTYDPVPVERFFEILRNTSTIFEEFRARFIGKASPVQFYWGSFDLAISRFSGRRAPPRPDADFVTQESYSHEVSSVGFWPGTAELGGPAYYSYPVPAPPGFEVQRIRPPSAWYEKGIGGFLLRYDDVRTASDPRAVLLEFCQSTYEAGARLAGWDRANLERAQQRLPAVAASALQAEQPAH